MHRWRSVVLRRMVDVHDSEVGALFLACAYGFSVFTAYAIVRPLRDAMALAGGVRDLPWLFAGTLAAMLAAHPLYSALVSRWPRRVIVAFTSRFFALNLSAFFVFGLILEGQAQLWLARVFFVWTSVFNLFVLSIFWSYLSDLFTPSQARRLFGFIAVGITLGGIVGSFLTATLAGVIDPLFLLPLSIVLLELSAQAASRLASPETAVPDTDRKGLGGGVFEGVRNVVTSPYLLGVASFMLIYTVTATFLYFIQAEVVSSALIDRAARTVFFARIDLAVNVLTVGLQVMATGRLIRRFGMAAALSLLPIVCIVGFLLMGSTPTLLAIAVFQIARRTTNYAVTRPAREVLYTVVKRADRYKAKNLIDTVVYRAGDQIGAWAWALMGFVGLGALATTWVAAPLSVVWLILGAWLGRQCSSKAVVQD